MIDLAASLEAASRQHAEGCVKTWEDLDRYRRVIAETKPDLIIECGTFSGKSAVWFASVARCDVITIDTDPHIDPPIREAMDRLGIEDFVTSSTSWEMIELVQQRAMLGGDKRVMVVLDSDHSKSHVAAEMLYYGPLVTPGCYMVVEDTLLRWMPDEERKHYHGDPLDAVESWMAVHDDEWVIDTELENLHPVTQFPSGWLRRL